MHLSRHLQFPEAQRDPEPEAFCEQAMASASARPLALYAGEESGKLVLSCLGDPSDF
jgi:hypothetical protein